MQCQIFHLPHHTHQLPFTPKNSLLFSLSSTSPSPFRFPSSLSLSKTQFLRKTPQAMADTPSPRASLHQSPFTPKKSLLFPLSSTPPSPFRFPFGLPLPFPTPPTSLLPLPFKPPFPLRFSPAPAASIANFSPPSGDSGDVSLTASRIVCFERQKSMWLLKSVLLAD